MASEGARRRDAALARAEEGAPEAWLAAARAAVDRVSCRLDEFTTDDVWAELERAGVGSPPERRALGAVVRTFARRGWIENTMRVRQSARPECNRRPVTVWRRGTK